MRFSLPVQHPGVDLLFIVVPLQTYSLPDDADDVTIKLDAYIEVLITCCLLGVWCDRSMSVLLGLTNGEGACAISSSKLTLFADFPRPLLRVIILQISPLMNSRRISSMSRRCCKTGTSRFRRTNGWNLPRSSRQMCVGFEALMLV